MEATEQLQKIIDDAPFGAEILCDIYDGHNTISSYLFQQNYWLSSERCWIPLYMIESTFNHRSLSDIKRIIELENKLASSNPIG